MKKTYCLIIVVFFVLNLYGCDIKPTEETNSSSVKNADSQSDFHPELHAKGLRLFNEGKYEEAIEAWSKELEIEPKNIQALNDIGIAYRNLGKPRKALEYHDKALSIRSDFGHAHYSQGLAYRDIQDFKHAEASFMRAIELNYKMADSYYNLGVSYKGEGNYSEALRAFNRSADLKPSYSSSIGDHIMEIREQLELIKLQEKDFTSPPDEFKFGFQLKTDQKGLFIEATPLRVVDEETRIAEHKMIINIRSNIPKDRLSNVYYYTSKLDTEALQKLIHNSLINKFSLVTEERVISAVTEGLYYWTEYGCGDEMYIAKLEPEDPQIAINAEDDTLIIKQPHQQIDRVSISSYTEEELYQSRLSELTPLLSDKFIDFIMSNQKRLSSKGEITSIMEQYNIQPEIHLYSAKDNASKYAAVSWFCSPFGISSGEGGCMANAFYLVGEDTGTTLLSPIFPLSTESGHIELSMVFQLNDRMFAFVRQGYFEWANEVIYEIKGDSAEWESYAESRGSGGC